MKKILLILSFFFAFAVNAQDKKMKPADAANADALELQTLVKLNDTQTQDFQKLFLMKYEMLENQDLSLERKSIITRTMEAKVRASLNEKQITALEANPVFFKKLIE